MWEGGQHPKSLFPVIPAAYQLSTAAIPCDSLRMQRQGILANVHSLLLGSLALKPGLLAR